jgi:hypothetical protein
MNWLATVVTNGFATVEDDAEAGPSPRLGIGNGEQRDRADAGKSRDEHQRPRSDEDPGGRGEQKRPRSDENPRGEGKRQQQQRPADEPKPKRPTDNSSGGSSRDAPSGPTKFKTKQEEVDHIMKPKRELMMQLTELMNMALDSFDYSAWKEIQGKLSKKQTLKQPDWRKMFDSIMKIILGVPQRRLPIVDNMGDDKQVPMGYTWWVDEQNKIVFKEYVKHTNQSISDISVVPIRHMTGLWPLYTKSLVTEEMFRQVLHPNESKRNSMQSKVPPCALGDWFLQWYDKNIYKVNGRKNSRYDEWLEKTFPEETSAKVRTTEAYGLWYQRVQEFFTDVVVPVSKVWTTVPPTLDRDADKVDDQCGPVVDGVSDGTIPVDDDTKWYFAAQAAVMKMDCSNLTAVELQQELLKIQLPAHSNKMDIDATALYICCSVKQMRGYRATDAAVVPRIGLHRA